VILVEACVDSVASCVAAERGGAHRLELCDALFDGGITPSAGKIAACKAAVSIPVIVMIRPRGGGFVYSDDERAVMRSDVIACRELGADGIAIGGLNADGSIDVSLVQELVDVANGMSVTFHRAFDFTPDLTASLELLISAGVNRILTSGGAPTAVEGADMIGSLVRQAGERAVIVAGGGIRVNNVRPLMVTSGVGEVHVRLTRLGNSIVGRPGLKLRKPLPENDLAWEETDEQRVREFVSEATR
jgi:copper homeostasis protein